MNYYIYSALFIIFGSHIYSLLGYKVSMEIHSIVNIIAAFVILIKI